MAPEGSAQFSTRRNGLASERACVIIGSVLGNCCVITVPVSALLCYHCACVCVVVLSLCLCLRCCVITVPVSALLCYHCACVCVVRFFCLRRRHVVIGRLQCWCLRNVKLQSYKRHVGSAVCVLKVSDDELGLHCEVGLKPL